MGLPHAFVRKEIRFTAATPTRIYRADGVSGCNKTSRWPRMGLRNLKLDGYRAIAIKSDGKLNLLSRRRNSFNSQYPLVLEL